MAFDKEIIEQVRSVCDIVDVIGEKITLKKQANQYKALCPFHNDKHPSLLVSRQKQIYKCFSCGSGGDVFKFLMEYEHLSFPEAIKALASKYNIPLPNESFLEGNSIDRFLSIKAINLFTTDLYHQYLLKHQKAKSAREYLKKRGLSKKSIEIFKIGYAPEEWHFLEKYLQKKKFSKKDILNSGLLGLRSKDQKAYDFFRDRIIFPIFNEKSEVIGFGGRRLNEQNEIKYLNTKESLLFKKRSILYGFSHGYHQILKEKQVYIVEGYLDVIACYLNKIPAVAPLGTALTREHLQKLKRYLLKINLLFDGDLAGKKALLKACLEMIKNEMEGFAIELPTNEDPYTFFKKNGKQSFLNFIKDHQVLIDDYIIQAYVPKQGNFSVIEKKKTIQQFNDFLLDIKDLFLRKELSKKIAKVLDVEVKLLQNHSPSFQKKLTVWKKKTQKDTSYFAIEREMMLFLCHHPVFVDKVLTIISLDEIKDTLSKIIFEKLINIENKEKATFNMILDLFENERIKDYLLTKFAQEDFFKHDNQEEQLTAYLWTLRRKNIDDEVKKITQKISDCLIHGNKNKLNELIEEKTLRIKERENLREYIENN